jgi:hypothetical protein
LGLVARITVLEVELVTARRAILLDTQARFVKGHSDLPGDGHEIGPLATIRSAR